MAIRLFPRRATRDVQSEIWQCDLYISSSLVEFERVEWGPSVPMQASTYRVMVRNSRPIDRILYNSRGEARGASRVFAA